MSVYVRNGRAVYDFIVKGKRYHGKVPIPEGDMTGDMTPTEALERRKLCSAWVEVYRSKTEAEVTAVGATEEDIRQNHTIQDLVNNYRYELTGAKPLPIEEVCELARKKPWAKDQNSRRCLAKVGRWDDFCAFMKHTFPLVRYAADIRKSHVEAYCVRLSSEGPFVTEKKNRDGAIAYRTEPHMLATSTVKSIIGDLRGLFSRIMEEAGALVNPFDHIVVLETEKAERQIFTPDELRLIGEGISGDEERRLAVCKVEDEYQRGTWLSCAEFCRPLFFVASMTGLTEGDICCLKWDDVNWDDMAIVKKRRKTGVHILAPILPALRKYLQGLKATAGEAEYVFPEHQQAYMARGVSYRVKTFLHGLGIETQLKREGMATVSVKDLHSMRHVFCYYAKKAGIPLETIAKIVGHATVAMTGHYADHDTAADLRSAIEKLPQILCAGELPESTESEEKERDRLASLAMTVSIDRVREALAYLTTA